MNSVHPSALRSTPFIDADTQKVREFANAHAGTGDAREKAVRLYYAVRDTIRYDMTTFGLDREQFKASNVLNETSAFCVPKAIALAAAARASGIPSRIGFADVRNHLTSPRFAALMDDELFRWHAYTSLWIDGRWVKATPAFDISLCEKHGVTPLEFDGNEDSIFHRFDQRGREHMEYVKFIGEFDEFPYEEFSDAMRVAYPRMLAGFDEARHARAAEAAAE
jgi:transglutaminase-like putative cysteine protease